MHSTGVILLILLISSVALVYSFRQTPIAWSWRSPGLDSGRFERKNSFSVFLGERTQGDYRLLESFTRKSTDKNSMSTFFNNVGITAKYVVSAATASTLLLSQSPLPLYYTVGALLNSATGKMLKRIIKQPRPAQSPKSGNGMPSSHTCAIAYFSYVIYYTSPLFVANQVSRGLLNFGVLAYGLSAW